ncbi:ATP-binding protein [Streptomyces sp. NBC_01550]|uniref:ATP-binding protein n=1 Tax=Streptomyces sp. NBC_01550 TaxID=2975875 RepID=UPI00386E46C9
MQAVRGGKLHPPTGRGRPADRHRVYFTTAAELAAKCPKAALEGRWKTCMRFFAGPRLLIVDEFGYLPLPEDGASALFQVINQRYLKSSTILTTNVGIADWAGAFGDATVAAMLDRLLHRTAVADIDGPSHRLRPSKPGRRHVQGTQRTCLPTPIHNDEQLTPRQLPTLRGQVHAEPESDLLLSPAARAPPTDALPPIWIPTHARSATASSP